MMEQKSRSDLFKELLVLLEFAAETTAKAGDEVAESHIRETLVPFVQKEHLYAEMLEE